VLFSNYAPNQIQLYHINGDANAAAGPYAGGVPQGLPAPYLLPDPTGNSSPPNTLTFKIHVSQLLTPAETLNQSAAQIATLANNIRYLQVNIVATNLVPSNQGQAMSTLPAAATIRSTLLTGAFR
jgi:hypothetical protein